MSDKTNTANNANALDSASCPPFVVEKKILYKVCDMCGYVNPETAALCKMCSNYLEGDAK